MFGKLNLICGPVIMKPEFAAGRNMYEQSQKRFGSSFREDGESRLCAITSVCVIRPPAELC